MSGMPISMSIPEHPKIPDEGIFWYLNPANNSTFPQVFHEVDVPHYPFLAQF